MLSLASLAGINQPCTTPGHSSPGSSSRLRVDSVAPACPGAPAARLLITADSMSDYLPYGCAYGERKCGAWGKSNPSRETVLIHGFGGMDKVIPDGRLRLFCGRSDCELDHVHPGEPIAWGFKPQPNLINKGLL
eukprot:8094445-Pyramimonas_sp.AAC.1